MSARHRPVWIAVGVLAAVWLLAWGGYRLASHARVTAEKVAAEAAALDLSKLRGEKRAAALRALAAKVNRLGPDDRRQVRLGRKLDGLLAQMSDQEKVDFIEATLPTGFKQMLTAFEQLPEERRYRAITNAVERMRRERDEGLPPDQAGNRPPVISPELQKKAVALGLKTFYSESSAQTKAEVAPLLEEIQRSMESGRVFRGPR